MTYPQRWRGEPVEKEASQVHKTLGRLQVRRARDNVKALRQAAVALEALLRPSGSLVVSPEVLAEAQVLVRLMTGALDRLDEVVNDPSLEVVTDDDRGWVPK
jgi:hypothetical protein